MELSNNTLCNQCLIVVGKPTLLIPGEGKLTLSDKEWNDYAPHAEDLLASGNVEITVDPVLSEEDKAELARVKLEEARALIAKADSK